MRKDDEQPAGYVQKVHEETWRFAQQLLTENERLRALTVTLQSDTRRLEEELLMARRVMECREQEQGCLQRQLTEIATDTHRLSGRYAELEQQNWNLMNLYVASHRLHGTLDRQEVLATIQEIITNLIGSEETAVFELDEQKAVLHLVASMGIDAARFRNVSLDSGVIGRVARTGEAFVATEADGQRSADEARLTACIPLKVEGRVTGAVAIFRLLEQKSGLESVDRELFDLLGSHAATALYCTALHAAVGGASGRCRAGHSHG